MRALRALRGLGGVEGYGSVDSGVNSAQTLDLEGQS